MSEILAPAGDKNSALAAINAGADAIYLGLKNYSARSLADNFDFGGFEEIAKTAHSFGVKVYVAMNTLVKDSEVEGFLSSAVEVWNRGADALIISDVFLGEYLKKKYPQIVLHLSTQAGVCNAYAALFAKEKGFERVILSRETDLEDIKNISKIIETEVFVQGALCTCFSGQCYFSSFAGGNSGNRGKCKQPCRKLYSIDRSGFEDYAYRLSLSDLSVGEDIKPLVEAGVASFKIEGRMRRPEYVSAAVRYYRNILDGCAGDSDLSDLKRTYNRGNYTRGLAFGQDKNFLSSAVQGHIGEFVGTVKVENGKYLLKSAQKFTKNDGFKVLRDGREIGGAAFLNEVKGVTVLSSRERLKNGDKVFITTDSALNCRLSEIKRSISVKISARLNVGQVAQILINGFSYNGKNPLSAAQTRPISEKDIKNCFKKTDKYPFEVSFVKIETDGVFMPASELNALRRDAFSKYFESISKSDNARLEYGFAAPEIRNSDNSKIAAICADLRGVKADIGILKPDNFFGGIADIETLSSGLNGEKYLYLPPYLTGAEIERMKPLAEKFDGIYCDGIYAFKLAEELNKPLFAGTGINISNKIDAADCNAKYFVISKELTVTEAKPLSTDNSFYLSAGAIKVMDLIYCPFERKCKTCDMRSSYILTDKEGRKFTLRRYKTGVCRFELYNCANLASEACGLGTLVDCSLENEPQKLVKICRNEQKLKDYFGGNFTRGHSSRPID